MNNDPHDVSTEDEGVDEDMMFEFEQELDTRLSLASGAHDDARCSTPVDRFAARPRNPVAAVLQSANEIEEEEFASLSASPFCDYGSPAATEHMAAAVGSMSAPAYTGEKSVFFDFNGRRKRKYFDDSCCVTPRVRPMAKRAKSFSCVDQVLLPSAASLSGGVVAAADTADKKVSPVLGSGQIFLAKRSDSIQIPHRAHRPGAPHAQRSSSGPAREQLTKPMDIPAAASDPLVSQASSWNASVEYFCRRSLDISSPLRIRFRDLVVGSVGRAGSLQTP